MLKNILLNISLSLPIILPGIVAIKGYLNYPNKFQVLNTLSIVCFANLYILWNIIYTYLISQNIEYSQLTHLTNPSSFIMGSAGLIYFLILPGFLLLNTFIFLSFLLRKNILFTAIYKIIFTVTIIYISLSLNKDLNIYHNINLLFAYFWLYTSIYFGFNLTIFRKLNLLGIKSSIQNKTKVE